jgi:hypothetical protein
MKRLKELAAVAVTLLSVSVFTGCDTYRYGTSGLQTSYENPQWAPPYYNGARYYYLPDIESYYDIYSREFIFLDHAQWIYSPYIPSIYSDFDLNNCFVVVVNSNIYQPWMHHQYYVSHFPRYYYRDYYDHSDIPYVRGFNENSRSAIYWTENERDRARSWDDENLRNNRQFRYSREDRLQQNNANNQAVYRQSPGSSYGSNNPRNNPGTNTNPAGNSGNNPVNQQPQNDNNKATQPAGTDNTTRRQPATTSETRRPHDTNYYGRPIGQPVKVDRQMRIQNTTGTTDKSSNSTGNQRSSSGNKNDQNKQGRR